MLRDTRNNLAPAVAVLALVMLGACGRADANERDASREVATVETRDLVIRVEASGEIEPLRLVEVKSNAGGELMRLHVDTGDEVQQGALLAEINPRDVRNSFAQAQADVEVARASVATRNAALERARELRQANIMTAQEFESAQLEATSARAQLVKAQTNLDLARERMGDITIRAPMSGTVVQKHVEQGQIVASATGNVSGGTTLLVMADLSAMQVRALVDQTDIGKLRVGQTARVTVDAYPNRSFLGEVTKIEPQATVEQNVTMFPVLVRLDNPERLLLPGMNADVEVSVDERRGVAAVPNGAVLSPRNALAAAASFGLDETAYRSALRPDAASRGAGGAGRDTLAAAGERRREGRTRMAGGDSGDGRAGVVFVQTANGPQPRLVVLGLNDLDFTEVVRGVEAGEQVLLVSGVELQQQQQQMMERMRQRSGGLPGTGASTGGGMRGGPR